MIKLINNTYFYNGRPITDANELGNLMMKYKDDTVFDELNFRKTAKELIDLKVETDKVEDYVMILMDKGLVNFPCNTPFKVVYPSNSVLLGLLNELIEKK